MSNTQPQTTYLKDYQPSDFCIESIDIHFDLYDDETLVKATLLCSKNPHASRSVDQICLDGEDMELLSVHMDGKLLDSSQFQVSSKHLKISNVPHRFKLETYVKIKPQENKSLSGLYLSRGNFCTQCEAEGFRRITYFLDRPDVMTRFTTTITADKANYPMLLSNGNLVSKVDCGSNRHSVCWQDPSLKPCYLFALVAGDFDLLEDEFITLSGRKVALRLYLEKGFQDQGAHALDALVSAMRWDEENFGREYDLDIYMIVAVSDFNMGAMENKGLNIFNTKFVLADTKTATDQDYAAIVTVIGHEYFHNWTGNRITCRDWFQLTLKEGLTVYRDQLFTEEMTSRAVARLDASNTVRNLQFSEDAGPTAHPIRPPSYMEINNFYTHTVYRKGAEVIRMISTLIGKDNFRAGMDLYFERHDGQAVTTEDFVKSMEDASGSDLTQFKRWYNQAGTPVLDIESVYNEQEKTLTLEIKQSCPATPGEPEKQPFHLPLAIGFTSSASTDTPTQLEGEESATAGTRVLAIKKATERFTFINVTARPVLSLLRNFSAPVRVNYRYSDDELLSLVRFDSDSFSRYDAGQQYFKRLVFNSLSSQQQGQPISMDDRILGVFREVLQQPNQEAHYLSRLLTIPSFNYLLQQNNVADIDAVLEVREFVKRQIADGLEALWLEVFHANKTQSYCLTATDVGRRALKNLALNYLTATSKEEYCALAFDQFQSSDNMTDCMEALLALNDIACEQRESALALFYQKWHDQPLVVNKWLLLQSMSLLPNTVHVVRDRLSHPAFDLCNPNNVYALVGGFSNNIPRFHDKSGLGYQLVAELIMKIDVNNPQVASRILQPLTRWQQFDSQRQQLMKSQLEKILTVPNLSPDVYELTTKSLV